VNSFLAIEAPPHCATQLERSNGKKFSQKDVLPFAEMTTEAFQGDPLLILFGDHPSV